jgi:glycine betaine/choline ABC-type transport system substrate-binding protein
MLESFFMMLQNRWPEIIIGTWQHIQPEKKQIIWMKPFAFNNTYTLAMRTDQANELSI